MKISKKNRRALASPDEHSVKVLAALPEDLHRLVKSEAALRKVKINEIFVEAIHEWTLGTSALMPQDKTGRK